ncbi:MAG: MotA/TolQ/ExbB proton channel [Planctomycetaceae bacterium]|nr:MotA/TolQ/ExbB proton channel [Planctomycetaceae bacterium]
MVQNMRSNESGMRVWYWMVVLALAFGLTNVAMEPGWQNTLRAQEDAEGDAKADTKADAKADAPVERRSYLMWIMIASGPFGACIAIESFTLVALIAMNIMQFRRDNFLPAALIEAFEQKIAARDYQGAYEAAKANDSYLGKVLTAGMARLSKGQEEAMTGMQEAGDEESMYLEHKMSYIGLIVATAPMLGLLGTVQGMIDSFRVIAESETSPKPKELAEGIMTALVTTMEGLVVAIPAIFAFGLFKNKIGKLQFEVGMVSEGLMSKLFASAKKGGAAPAAATAAAPANPSV